MVHRLHTRNNGYNDTFTNTLANNQETLKATEGATALQLDNVVDEKEISKQKLEDNNFGQTDNVPSLENVSIENATYLQNLEETQNNNDFDLKDEVPNFEVDSIELATPELFSDHSYETHATNEEISTENEPTIFEKSETESEEEIKEPEMFEETNLEEDFEIPAFLRKQKN